MWERTMKYESAKNAEEKELRRASPPICTLLGNCQN